MAGEPTDETAQFLPPERRDELTGMLLCYARSVIATEWPAMDRGTLRRCVQPLGFGDVRTMRAYQPATAAEESAYDRWMDQTGVREQARIDRVHGVEGGPAPDLDRLFVIAALLLLLLVFFDNPHGDGVGRLEPVAVERSLRLIAAAVEVAEMDPPELCDSHGRAR